MISIQLEQGSPEWLAWRKGKLTASKSAIILGHSPYTTAYQLWEEELGLREPQASAPHMQRGLEIEDIAREWFYITIRTRVEPCVVQHPTMPEFIASLDGMSADGKVILEIKYNRKELHELARQGQVCDMHRTQMQHQMFITGLDICFYLSYRENDPILFKVQRDKVFIADMVEKELAFKRCVDDLIPPELTDRDYEDLSHDSELSMMMREYNTELKFLKKSEEIIDRLKRSIMEKVGSKNAKGTNWKVTKYTRQGNVNYDAILDHFKIETNLEQFRKPSTVSYRITVG